MKRLLLFLLIPVVLPLTTYAQSQKTVIEAPVLRWEPSERRYHFQGGVTITGDNSSLQAEEVYYSPDTHMAHARGGVLYRDRHLQIQASEATLDLRDTRGTLKKGRVLFFEGNYRIRAALLERLSETHYRGKTVQYTTCSGSLPIWCLRASRADLKIGQRLSATHVRLHILGVPVLYTPYLWVPVLTERTTGFLMPRLGYNSERGFEVSLPFYLVISENRDATFYLDWAEGSRGYGIEYRYIERHLGSGQWFLYRFEDMTTDRTFYSFTGTHRKDTSSGTGGFLSVNYLSEKDYYRLYSYRVELLTSRFTASTGQLYRRTGTYRLYLTTRVWQNLASEAEPIQHLPTGGFVLYPIQKGPVLVGLRTEAGRFYQKDGIEAYRLMVLPYASVQTGGLLKLGQSIEPFGAYYRLKDGTDNDTLAYGLTYRADLSMSVLSGTGPLSHSLTPEVSYEYRTRKRAPSYVFDQEETDRDLSLLKASLLQRFYLEGHHIGAWKLSHIYDLRTDDARRVVLEGYTTGTFHLRFDIHYRTDTSRVSAYHYQAGLSFSRFSITAGESYSRAPAIRNYTATATVKPLRWLTLTGGLWYDERQGQFTKLTYGGTLDGQCASLSVTYSETPSQYSVFFLLTLKGLGEVRYGDNL